MKSSTAPEAHSAPGDARVSTAAATSCGSRHPVERALGAGGLPRLTHQRCARHLGLDEPGRDAGDGDAVGCETLGHRLSEGVQPRFARAVRRDVGLPAIGPAGPDVHDAPHRHPVGRGLVDHPSRHAPREVGRAEQVGREGALPDLHPVLVGRVLQRVVATAAPVGTGRWGHDHRRVVDEDVDPAECGGGVLGEARHGIRVGEVSRDERVPGAGQPREHGGRAVERVGAPVVDRDPVPVLGERAGDGGTDPARCSGDEDSAGRDGGSAHARHPSHAGRAGPPPRSRPGGRAGRPSPRPSARAGPRGRRPGPAAAPG